jgi:hypothetical protein
MEEKIKIVTAEELMFLEDYRQSADYQRALGEWRSKQKWEISAAKEGPDGRNALLVEGTENKMRVTNRIIVEANEVDRFVERALECAEQVRAAEQGRKE